MYFKKVKEATRRQTNGSEVTEWFSFGLQDEFNQHRKAVEYLSD